MQDNNLLERKISHQQRNYFYNSLCWREHHYHILSICEEDLLEGNTVIIKKEGDQQVFEFSRKYYEKYGVIPSKMHLFALINSSVGLDNMEIFETPCEFGKYDPVSFGKILLSMMDVYERYPELDFNEYYSCFDPSIDWIGIIIRANQISGEILAMIDSYEEKRNQLKGFISTCNSDDMMNISKKVLRSYREEAENFYIIEREIYHQVIKELQSLPSTSEMVHQVLEKYRVSKETTKEYQNKKRYEKTN